MTLSGQKSKKTFITRDAYFRSAPVLSAAARSLREGACVCAEGVKWRRES
jgi:hypothetical protein